MRPEKQLLLDEINHNIDQSQAMVFASYQKLDPNLAYALRARIGKSGGVFEIVRKRILMKAAEKKGIALPSGLEGHIAVVFAKDPVEVMKAIYQFKTENEDVLTVLGGRFEGQILTSNDVEQISKLPSRDVMRAQLLGVLEAPLSETLAVVEALLTSVMHCLDNKSKI